MTALKEKYINEAMPALKESTGISNNNGLPRLSKVIVNMGMGIVDKDALKRAVGELGALTGQQPLITKARKSISNFKLREGMSIGAKVTLRRARMYDFLDRLINCALPRIRDFRGVSATGFDGRGNYTLGVTDQTIFPEIDPNDAVVTQGMNITIVTTAEKDTDAKEMLKLIGMPFSNN